MADFGICTFATDYSLDPARIAREVEDRGFEPLFLPVYHGEHMDFDPIWSYPKPHRPSGPPILIGASPPWVFDRAAEYADGWMPNARHPERAHAGLDFSEGLARSRASFKAAGRSADEVGATGFSLGPNPEQVESLIEAGFNRIVFMVPPVDESKALGSLDRYQRIADTFGA